MTKKAAKVEINNFVKGFITEASPLNFPENASLDELNFEAKRDGTRERRLGIDFETGFVFDGFEPLPGSRVETFVWKGAGPSKNEEFLVLRYGSTLVFYDLTKDIISANKVGFIGGGFLSVSDPWQYASVDGKLVIATGKEGLTVIERTPGVGTGFSFGSTIFLKVRDFWGLPKEIPLGERSSTNSETIDYNLRNQGWNAQRAAKIGTSSSYSFQQPIYKFLEFYGTYPGDHDNIWTGIVTIAGTVPFEAMEPSAYTSSIEGIIQAPKGGFIIDLLHRASGRALNARFFKATDSIFQKDITTGGPTLVAEFAGRLFYSGFNGEVVNPIATSPDLSKYVAFSQNVKDITDAGKCYQEGDPTSREFSDLVDTDGGLIRISGVDKIVGMRALGKSLIVFGSNGVWEIKGGSDYGFTATSYQVIRISAFGAVNFRSIVPEQNSIFYWSKDGINVITFDQFGELVVQNLSLSTIQTFYENIPTSVKEEAIGVFDSFRQQIKWLYDGNKEIVLDTTLGAFTKNEFALEVDGPIIHSTFPTLSFRTGTSQDNIIVDTGDEVLVGTDQVIITKTVRTSGVSSVKYAVTAQDEFGSRRFTFAALNNVKFKDWGSDVSGGYDAKAYIVTGAVTGNDTSVHKQVPYLTMHFRRTESGMELSGDDPVPANQSSCLIRSQWDWASSSLSNKWSPLFQAYRYRQAYLPADVFDPFDTGFSTVVTKNKLRGRGRAFSLYMETEPEKDCRILGWNLTVNANTIT